MRKIKIEGDLKNLILQEKKTSQKIENILAGILKFGSSQE